MPTSPFFPGVNRNWQAQTLTISGSHWDIARGGHLNSHGARAKKILKNATYGSLFAYLWRRFGPPESGYDDYKELVNYWITTPLEGVGFGFSCSPTGLDLGTFYALSEKWVNRIYRWENGLVDKWMQGLAGEFLENDALIVRSAWAFAERRGTVFYDFTKESPSMRAYIKRVVSAYTLKAGPCPHQRRFYDTSFHKEPPLLEQVLRSPHRTILAAIEAGLMDLLRPVAIRDSYINACGKVPDGSPLIKRAVEFSPRAGCGCSPDLMDAGNDWFTLAGIIRKKGVSASLNILRGTEPPVIAP